MISYLLIVKVIIYGNRFCLQDRVEDVLIFISLLLHCKPRNQVVVTAQTKSLSPTMTCKCEIRLNEIEMAFVGLIVDLVMEILDWVYTRLSKVDSYILNTRMHLKERLERCNLYMTNFEFHLVCGVDLTLQ